MCWVGFACVCVQCPLTTAPNVLSSWTCHLSKPLCLFLSGPEQKAPRWMNGKQWHFCCWRCRLSTRSCYTWTRHINNSKWKAIRCDLIWFDFGPLENYMAFIRLPFIYRKSTLAILLIRSWTSQQSLSHTRVVSIITVILRWLKASFLLLLLLYIWHLRSSVNRQSKWNRFAKFQQQNCRFAYTRTSFD